MKKLLYFLQPYKNKLLLMIGLLFIQVMGTLYIPTLTADIVNNGIVAGDLDIVEPDQAKIRGTVRNITFKGVHYEILVETELRTYMVHTTDYAEVGREVGLKFGPEDIHVMCRMGGY